jgi:hypothetical protein
MPLFIITPHRAKVRLFIPLHRPVSLTPAANFLPALMTLVANYCWRHCENFTTFHRNQSKNLSDQFAAPVVHLANCQKIRNCAEGIISVSGETIHERKLRSKIS